MCIIWHSACALISVVLSADMVLHDIYVLYYLYSWVTNNEPNWDSPTFHTKNTKQIVSAHVYTVRINIRFSSLLPSLSPSSNPKLLFHRISYRLFIPVLWRTMFARSKVEWYEDMVLNNSVSRSLKHAVPSSELNTPAKRRKLTG